MQDTLDPKAMQEANEIQDLINREKFDVVAMRYAAKAQVYAENYADEALVYATIANTFANIEVARSNWAQV